MTIHEELREELKDAMRKRDQDRLDVIRAVETDVKMARSAKGFKGDVDDALYQKVIGAYVKKMSKAKEEYDQLGDPAKEMAEKLGFEVKYLSKWLPKLMGEEETRNLVTEAIAELGASDPKQAGRVVGHLMKEHKGALDGALVNRIAREALTPKKEEKEEGDGNQEG